MLYGNKIFAFLGFEGDMRMAHDEGSSWLIIQKC
jgi:hypothetical protein